MVFIGGLREVGRCTLSPSAQGGLPSGCCLDDWGGQVGSKEGSWRSGALSSGWCVGGDAQVGTWRFPACRQVLLL